MNPVDTLIDRSQPPAPDRLRSFAFPEFHQARLDNGLQILAAGSSRVPLMSLQILVPAGAQYEPMGTPGLASLHGGLLDEGTTDQSSLNIAHRVEGLGGTLSSGAGWNMAFAELGLLSRHFFSGLELLAEVIRSPDFPPAEIERLRLERQVDLLRRKDMPGALAQKHFATAVYDGTIYGRSLIGTEESLPRIDRESLRQFYRHHVGPAGSTVIAVGDLDPEATIARVTEAFGDWRGAPLALPPSIEPPVLQGTEVHIVDRPGSAQTQLQLGHSSIPRSHPGFPQTTLLNTILGGKFTSRINLNLREKHGFTYGASSTFVRRQGPGPFVIRAAVATDVAGAAVEQLLFELRRIRRQPVGREELEETRDYLIGVFPYTLQTIGDLARRLEALAVFDLPLDFYDSYPAVLADIDRDALLAAAREHLRPDQMVIVAVGTADELRPQLEGFGPVTVHQP